MLGVILYKLAVRLDLVTRKQGLKTLLRLRLAVYLGYTP